MAFIGVILEDKNELRIKKIIDRSLNYDHKEHTVIIINERNIENIRNIRFDTILIVNIKESLNKEMINCILNNTKYLILNSDINKDRLEIINNLKLNVITFGFNQKSTITASSVEDDFIICIQRKIIDSHKKILEPQEIAIKIENKKLLKNANNLLGIASTLLIYGKTDIIF